MMKGTSLLSTLRRSISALTVLLALLAALPARAQVVFNATNFPDPNFRQYLKGNFRSYGFTTEGVTISEANLNSILNINCSKKSISSVKGIEHFPNLELLNCNDNQLTELDVSQNVNLKILYLQHSVGITSLDLSNNTKLERLNIKDLRFTSVDLSNNKELKVLFYSESPTYDDIDLSANTELLFLSVHSTNISSIDLSKQTQLIHLNISNMPQMESIDLNKNTELRTLNVHDMPLLRSLDLSKNTKLRGLKIYNTAITELDLCNQTDLWHMECHNNQLTELDLSEKYNLGTPIVDNSVFDNDYLASMDHSTTIADWRNSETVNYTNQKRDLRAQSFKITENGESKVYYYFRLGGTGMTSNEKTLVESITETNYMNVPSKFDASRVRSWDSGCRVIRGTRSRRVTVPDGEVTPDQVYGDILLLTDYEEEGGTASGTITYTYDVNYGTPTAQAFTINWTADATGPVTSVVDLPADALHGQPVGTTYYNALGMAADRPFEGVNIVVTRYSDGTVTTSKLLK